MRRGTPSSSGRDSEKSYCGALIVLTVPDSCKPTWACREFDFSSAPDEPSLARDREERAPVVRLVLPSRAERVPKLRLGPSVTEVRAEECCLLCPDDVSKEVDDEGEWVD